MNDWRLIVSRKNGPQIRRPRLHCLALVSVVGVVGCVGQSESVSTDLFAELQNPEAQFYGQPQCGAETLLGEVRAGSDCSKFNGSSAVRSVKIAGTCQVASAANVRAACETYLGGEIRAIVYGVSEVCADDTAVASVTSTTDCSSLSSSVLARSIKIEGKCIHIDAINVRAVCALRQAGAGRAVLFAFGSCRDTQALASVSEKTECQALGSSETVGSVKVRGTCIDIAATTLRSVCLQTQSSVGRTLVYGTSTNCDDRALVGSFTRTTDCQAFSDVERVRSIKVDGKCIESATTARKACINRH
jgi:hypothetical protein